MVKDIKIARQYGITVQELENWKLAMQGRMVKIKQDFTTTDIASVFTKYSIGPTDLLLMVAYEMVTPEEVESYGLQPYLDESRQAKYA